MNSRKSWALCALVGMIGISFSILSHARITGTQPTNADAWCAGPSGAEVCVDSSGNVVPTTTDDASSGSSSYRWSNVFTTLLNVSGASTLTGALGATTITASTSFRGPIPTVQTVGEGGTVSADACGGVKTITTNGAYTTDTTNSITAPAAAYAGCAMDIVYVGTEGNGLTLDANNNFKTYNGANVRLGQYDVIRIFCTGAAGTWYQVGTVSGDA